jgi:hypothetical protein
MGPRVRRDDVLMEANLIPRQQFSEPQERHDEVMDAMTKYRLHRAHRLAKVGRWVCIE